MPHWSRPARWIVAATGLVFAALVVVGLRYRERPVTPAPIAPVDPRANAEITGATSHQWRGANENFTVTADRQFLYRDGGVKLEGVTIYVDDRQGNRKFMATGLEGVAGANQDYVNLKGEVKLVSSDGLEVETPEASYSTKESVVRAPGPVTFSRGRMTGRGLGMTYDRNSNLLWLQDQAAVTMAPDEHGAGKLEVTATAAGLARKDKYLRFEHDVHILRDNRHIQTDNAVGYLSDDESRLTSLDLKGNAHIVTAGGTAGVVKDMSARDITIRFRDDGEQIERAVLVGNASIQLAGEGGMPGRRIAGGALDVGLNPDGVTISSLNGRDAVQLEFPADGTAPARSVRAGMLDGTSSANGELSGARLTDTVEYRELVGASPATPVSGTTAPIARVVRARMLDLTFTPGMSAITRAGFSGAVRIDQGELHATATTARYNVDRGVIELSGEENETPTMSDARITVDAREIVLTLEGPKVTATGAVRSVLRPQKKVAASGNEEPADQVRLPGFLADNEPVNVTADALSYDGAMSRAVYDGTARLWQNDAAVQGDSLTIDSKAGSLTATGSVRSTWMVEEVDEKTKQRKDVPTIASARDLDYDDAARRATYTTGAHLIGPHGDLVAAKIELFLAKDDNQLEHVEGYEAVTMRESGRSAAGDRLSYLAVEQRYQMTGTPVRIVEECRESTGRTVTFFKSTDRILVDGQQVSRTRTKSGENCR